GGPGRAAGHLSQDRDFAVTRHHDQVALAARHGLDVVQAYDTFVARLERGLFGAPAGGTADMERAHRELRSRFADRLRGHDADRFAHVDLMSAAEVAPVALDAHPLARLA